jgi:hypothetical protein
MYMMSAHLISAVSYYYRPLDTGPRRRVRI